jgi:hypothetical protein
VADVITIKGFSEFRRGLKKIDADAPKQLRIVGNEAAQLIVDTAKPRVPIGPPAGGHARDSLRVASTSNAARVRGGGRQFSYYPWLDFGGRVGRRKSVKRPFLKSGRYLWKAYSDRHEEVQKKLEDGLKKLAESVGFEVSE